MSENIKLQISSSENINIIPEDNKHYNKISTTDDIFKKIRKKDKIISANQNIKDDINIESKETINNQDKSISKNNFGIINNYSVIINIISFIFFYLSFEPITDYYYLFNFFLFPIDFIQFLLCLLSGIITTGFIFLIILKKLPGYHLIYMLFYYIFIFFLHHFKYVGTSHFEQSFVIFYEFASILIHFLCILFIIYYLVKYHYYKGNLKKNNEREKLFATKRHSYDTIKRTETENLLNEKNLVFIYKRNKIHYYKPCIIIIFFF